MLISYRTFVPNRSGARTPAAGFVVTAMTVFEALLPWNTYTSLMSRSPRSEPAESEPRLGASRWSAAPAMNGAAPRVSATRLAPSVALLRAVRMVGWFPLLRWPRRLPRVRARPTQSRLLRRPVARESQEGRGRMNGFDDGRVTSRGRSG